MYAHDLQEISRNIKQNTKNPDSLVLTDNIKRDKLLYSSQGTGIKAKNKRKRSR